MSDRKSRLASIRRCQDGARHQLLKECRDPVPGPLSHTVDVAGDAEHTLLGRRASPHQATVLSCGGLRRSHSHSLMRTQRQERLCTNIKPVLKSPL